MKAWLGWCCGLALSSSAEPARAWGDDGHRVIGEIAWRYLSPQARAAVAESLSEPGYTSLAEAATWPDTFARRKREYDAMKPFHYVNVDPQAGAYVAARDCPNGCVVSALDDFSALLGSEPPLSLSERRFAIYWVAHLVGDIHQPLHVAHPDGKGGTATPVLFFGEAQRPNAHWVWDVGLIEHRPPELAFAASKDPPAWRALGESLAASITPAQLRSWRAATSAEAWATESLALSRREAFLTPGAVIDAAYEARHWPSVAQQLEKAGVRLAALLERTLGPKATPATR